jgi:hypothetical protein
MPNTFVARDLAWLVAQNVDDSAFVQPPDRSTLILILTVVAVILVGLAITTIALLIKAHRRRLVEEASVALKELASLNYRSEALVPVQPPIRLAFKFSANSKASFDRYDLTKFMSLNVLENGAWIDQELESRLVGMWHFRTYKHDVEALAHQLLGTSFHRRVNEERFAAIEQKLFLRLTLPSPTATARVVSTVGYTSPKGRNSYSRKLEWGFDELQAGLANAKAVRAKQSSAAAMRQRERSLMTPGLRMDILRRDMFRCKMCGAAASDGATLHVDHINPVSKGGKTTAANLQALCQSCNIGKSNKFVG